MAVPTRGISLGAVLIIALLGSEAQGAPPAPKPRAILPLERDYLASPEDLLAPGTKFNAFLRTGKSLTACEAIETKRGAAAGTIRAVVCKNEKMRRQELAIDSIVRLQVDGRTYDVLSDPEHKSWVILDQHKRDAEVAERIGKQGHKLAPVRTDVAQAELLRLQKAHLDEVSTLLPGKPFKLYESQVFLIYSDVPAKTIAATQTGLEKMYDQLSQMCGVAENENIWTGKLLIVILADRDSFVTYSRHFFRSSMPTEAISRQKMDGRLIIVGEGIPVTLSTSLPHAVSRAFIDSYRSNVPCPRWLSYGIHYRGPANAGFTDATKIVEAVALAHMRMNGTLGGIYAGDATTSWGQVQAGASSQLIEYMYRLDPSMFRIFVTLVKEGHDVNAALKETYRMTRADLTQQFGRSIGVPNLRE